MQIIFVLSYLNVFHLTHIFRAYDKNKPSYAIMMVRAKKKKRFEFLMRLTPFFRDVS